MPELINTFLVLAVEDRNGDYHPLIAIAIANLPFLNPVGVIAQALLGDTTLHADIFHIEHVEQLLDADAAEQAIITPRAIAMYQDGKRYIE